MCELPATVDSDLTLTAGVSYLMTDRVTVGNGNGQLETNGDGTLDDGSAVQAVTLTIEAGVEVRGKTGTFAIVSGGVAAEGFARGRIVGEVGEGAGASELD